MNIENISKRQNAKLVDIEERTFKIKKFDPLMGNYILLQIMRYVLPFGISEKVGVPDSITNNVDRVNISKKDFIELQRDVLSVCYETLPAGDAPIVRDDGTYGVMDFNSNIAIRLLIAAFTFNFSDFFGENGLTSLLDNKN